MRWLALLMVSLVACLPELDARPSLIESPRIIAVISEPAEAKPGEVVHFRVVVASPEGAVEETQAYWSLCLSPKPPAENNSVNQACWNESYKPVAGPAEEVDIELPMEACELFGPEVKSADLRPRDPDASGGYYQPIRVAIPELAGFGFQRVRCALPNASIDDTLEFDERYRANRNPTLVAFETAVDVVEPSDSVALRVEWAPDSKETFVVHDLATQAVVEQTEELRVSWFANAGSFTSEVTGETGSNASLNSWVAPASGGTVTLWAVLRDSRGGVAVSTIVREMASR